MSIPLIRLSSSICRQFCGCSSGRSAYSVSANIRTPAKLSSPLPHIARSSAYTPLGDSPAASARTASGFSLISAAISSAAWCRALSSAPRRPAAVVRMSFAFMAAS